MEPFDRIGGACALPLAVRQPGKEPAPAKAGVKSRSPASSRLSATALHLSRYSRLIEQQLCFLACIRMLVKSFYTDFD